MKRKTLERSPYDFTCRCGKRAYKTILGIPLCKIHYFSVKDELKLIRVGRPKKLKLSEILEWLESNQKEITLKTFISTFKVSYPTAQSYLKLLTKYGFLENGGGVWKLKI